MDELVKLVSEKSALSEEASKEVIEVVVGYLKKKLPPPLGAQIDNVLSGGGVALDDVGGLAKGLGGLLSKE